MSAADPSVTAPASGMAWARQVLVLTVLYAVAGRLGLALSHFHENATLVWPPTGLALAALILFGTRLWPGVFAGALLVSLSTSATVLTSLTIAFGNTLEAVLGSMLLVRVVGFRPAFERLRDVLAFLLIGVVGCTIVSATIGVAGLRVFGNLELANTGFVWLIWWLGDAGGALVFTPVLLSLTSGGPPWRELARRPESWLALARALGISGIAFLTPTMGILRVIVFLPCFPVLAWAGTRLGSRGANLVSFIIVSAAIAATAAGVGPFAATDPTAAMLLLWTYAMVVGMTALTLAAVVEQRDIADRAQLREESERMRIQKENVLLLERARLTRELHDGLGGQLVSVLSMVERELASPREVAEGLRRALDDIRIVIDSLDPHTTDLNAALGKLRARLEPLLRRNEIDLVWRVDDFEHLEGDESLGPQAVLHLLRIIQESVTNALRHAAPTRIEVTLRCEGDARVDLSVRDDGCGFDVLAAPRGRGLENMRRRAEEIGAQIRIEDAAPGTRIELTLARRPSPSDRG